MKKIIFLILLFFVSFVSFGQVYQAMPQYGYGPVKRMDFDSSLTIPTTCGVPTLKTILTKKAAIAFDSCNNRFYQYNPKTSTWSTIGGGSDTFNLQQVLNKGNTAMQSLGAYGMSLSDNSGYTLSLNSTGLQSTNGNDHSYGYYGPANFFLNDGSSQNMTGGVADNGSFLDISNVYGNKINLTSEYTTNVPYLSWFNNQDGITQKLLPQYSLANSDIYMPYRNPSDTLATLSDLRDINIQNGRFGNDTATIVMAKVHNDAGVTLTNGKVVAFSTSGTSSDAPSVKLANNKADSTSATTFGFVSGTIAVNDTGYVILSGKIEKLNTSAFANGDIIYLDSISGQWTKSKPVAPYHLVYLGTVVKANAGNGSIYVKVQNGYEMEELHNVKINGVVNNQVLAYSDTQQLWKNRNIYSIVDTTTTVATKSNVALKLNISDSASMLNPYLRKIDTTNKFVNTITRTAGKDSIIFYIGGTRYAIKDSTGGGGTTYTFSTGLTNTANTITNNLSTGVSGGQSVVGGTAASDNLTLSSTTNATKGKIFLGANSAFDEVNNRIGIGTTSPSEKFEITGTDYAFLRTSVTNTTGNNETGFAFLTYDGTSVAQNGGVTSTNSTFNYQAYGANATVLFSSKSGGLGLMSRNAAAGNIRFYTGGDGSGNERMRIFNGGNVAIGTSTDAGYKLDINGTGRVVTSLQTPQINGNTTSGGTLTLQSTTNATKGKILFGTSAYDEVNNRLGIGTASPSHPFHLTGSTTASSAIARGAYLNNTLVAAANNDVLSGLDITPTFTNGAFTGVGNYHIKLGSTIGISSDNQYSLNNLYFSGLTSNQGTSVIFRPNGTPTDFGYSFQFQKSSSANSNNLIIIGGGSVAGGTNAVNKHVISTSCDGTISAQPLVLRTAPSNTNWSGVNDHLTIFSTGNVVIQNTSTSATDAGYRLDVNGTARVQGALNFNPTNTAAGTTGNQTINKASGTVNIAAAGTTITVTNNLVTTSSIVFAVIRTNDATATIKNVVPASGSFTINLNAAATAETSIGFFVIN